MSGRHGCCVPACVITPGPLSPVPSPQLRLLLLPLRTGKLFVRGVRWLGASAVCSDHRFALRVRVCVFVHACVSVCVRDNKFLLSCSVCA